jgi:hypothetical protein
MSVSNQPKRWWQVASRPREHNRDAIEQAKVTAVIGELPADSEAVKAFNMGAHTALLIHLSPVNRPELRERLRSAMAEGNTRHRKRTKPLGYFSGASVKRHS